MGVKPIPYLTGEFVKRNQDGEAIFRTGKKDEKGNDRFEVFDDRHTFEAVSAPRPAPAPPAPVPAVKRYPAGPGFRAVRELRKTPGGRRKAKVTTKKAAKKTCSPGYDVYNFRKTRKGVFYDCLPKKRKTRRNRK
jgi:hypothetical protein